MEGEHTFTIIQQIANIFERITTIFWKGVSSSFKNPAIFNPLFFSA